jgi:hypothetical protein
MKTKFFTTHATGGSKGEASAEDMKRGYTDALEDEMPEDGIWPIVMSEDGGGFAGRPKGWER